MEFEAIKKNAPEKFRDLSAGEILDKFYNGKNNLRLAEIHRISANEKTLKTEAIKPFSMY